MTRAVIHVDKLSKRYRIGEGTRRHAGLRHVIDDALSAPVRLLARLVQRSQRNSTDHGVGGSDIGANIGGTSIGSNGRASQFIWALKDIDFEIRQGEVVGLIGRNGAGKSTLLKILARITRPTEGYAEIRGRVGSLLEVGTGFHGELTGRENVYMSGAILGMRKAEIDRKFDEIIAFSEVERFLDTPLKHYSSGMQMRLAFAVAAHLEPDILFIDEVLAVGDAEFQKKCIGKMGDIAKHGRTILFVSHNTTAIQSLCSRAIWLKDGSLAQDGTTAAVMSSYLSRRATATTVGCWPDQADAPGNDKVRIRSVSVRPEPDEEAENGDSGLITVRTPFVMEFEYWNLRPQARLHLSILVYTKDGVLAFNTGPATDRVWHGKAFPAGLFRSVCHVPGDLLNDGLHRLSLLVVENEANVIYRQDDFLTFEVHEVGANRKGWLGNWPGATRPLLRWTTELLSPVAVGQGTHP